MPRRASEAATSKIERLAGAALYALHQPVERDQASGVGILPHPLRQLRHVVRRPVGCRDVDDLENIAVRASSVLDAFLPAELHGIQTAMGDDLVDLFQRLIGEEADHAGRPVPAIAHRVDYLLRIVGRDAAVTLRDEDHADEVGPSLGGHAGVLWGFRCRRS